MAPRAKPYRFTDLERWTRSQLLVLKTLIAYLPGSGLGSEFKEALRDAISKLTGAEVDVWLDSIGPATGKQVLAKINEPACLVTVGLLPSDHQVLLDLDLKLAGMVVDKMLGGTGEEADTARPLSSIEKGLVGFVLLKLLHAAQTVLAEEQQVALRLKHISPNADEIKEWMLSQEHVVLGFKIFLDMQVAYARLVIPHEMIRTQLAVTMEPGGPMANRRLDRLRRNMPRIASARTTIIVEAGRSELTEADLDGVDEGDILLVEKTGLRKAEDSLSGTVECRVGDGTHGVVRGNLVELEGGGQGVEITAIECFPEPDPAQQDVEQPEEMSAQDAVEGGGEEEQSTHTRLRPAGTSVGVSHGVTQAFSRRARGVGGDALEEPFNGEHQVDEDEQQYEEEQPAEEEGEQQDAPAEEPGDNLGETEGLLKDIAMPVVVELGRIKTSAGDIIGLRPGQILELRRAPNDPVDITVNGKLVGKGELVEVEGELGVRLVSLVR